MATASYEATAMNLLDDDHVAGPIVEGRVVAALFESHDDGAACTTLVKDRACCL